jgi:hypothetical protein
MNRPPESGALDEAALLALVGGDQKLAGELAGLFLTDIEPRMKQITACGD